MQGKARHKKQCKTRSKARQKARQGPRAHIQESRKKDGQGARSFANRQKKETIQISHRCDQYRKTKKRLQESNTGHGDMYLGVRPLHYLSDASLTTNRVQTPTKNFPLAMGWDLKEVGQAKGFGT